MNIVVIFAKLISLYLFDNFDRIVTYEEILSLRSPLQDDIYEQVQEGMKWLREIQKYLTVYDKPLSPEGIYATCKEWLRGFGEFVGTGDYKEEYIEKDPDMYKIAIIDHLGLVNGTGSKKERMDLVSNYFIYFRNKCNLTGVFVQQLNRNSKSVERKISGYELLDNADLSDSSGPAQAAEIILLLYYPYREKIPKVEGYPIQTVLKDKFRLLQCTKNRFGRADINIGTMFYGDIGMFRELPKPSEIEDYSVYLNPGKWQN